MFNFTRIIYFIFLFQIVLILAQVDPLATGTTTDVLATSLPLVDPNSTSVDPLAPSSTSDIIPIIPATTSLPLTSATDTVLSTVLPTVSSSTSDSTTLTSTPLTSSDSSYVISSSSTTTSSSSTTTSPSFSQTKSASVFSSGNLIKPTSLVLIISISLVVVGTFSGGMKLIL